MLDCARIRDKERSKEYAYRIYVSDALKIFCENLAQAFGGNALSVRLYDILEQNTQPEDNRTAEEIIADISGKLAAMGEDEVEKGTI